MVQVEVLGSAGGREAMGSIAGWPGPIGVGVVEDGSGGPLCLGALAFAQDPLITRGAGCKQAFIPGKGWGPSLVSDGTWGAMLLGRGLRYLFNKGKVKYRKRMLLLHHAYSDVICPPIFDARGVWGFLIQSDQTILEEALHFLCVGVFVYGWCVQERMCVVNRCVWL